MTSRSYYPTQIDTREVNGYFSEHIDFEDRNSSSKVTEYTIYADDVNACVDAIISIEKTVGLPNGSIANSVYADIKAIKNFVMMNDTNYDNLDERYMWGGTKPAGASLTSILGHTHTGATGHPSKIKLTSEVQGLLPKDNINRSTSGITGNNILLSSASSTITISQEISSKLDERYDNTMQKTLTVQGNTKLRSYVEIDVKDLGGNNTNVTDTECSSDIARKFVKTDSSSLIALTQFPLNYGNYCAIVRIKMSNNTSSTANADLCNIKIVGENGSTTLCNKRIQMSDLEMDNYTSIYMNFNHKHLTPISNRKKYIYIYITGISSSRPVDVYFDTIIITPITIAIYDKE